MSGSVDHAAGVLMGPLSERDATRPGDAAEREARWTLSRTFRRFSQLTFAYGLSAAFATASAAIMSLPGSDAGLQVFVAILPFVISVLVAGSVLTDLLDLLWEGVAGRLPTGDGLGGRLWIATFLLLLVGMVAFVIGVAFVALGLGARGDYSGLTPWGVAFLGVCGLSILAAMVVPSLAFGPRTGQWVATGAAMLGAFAVTEESIVAFNPPFGSSPFLGWMEGTFPLLNWNVGFGAVVALSAFLIWWSYRYLLPRETRGSVPVA